MWNNIYIYVHVCVYICINIMSCAEKFASERLFPGVQQYIPIHIHIYMMSCAEKFASEASVCLQVDKERATYADVC